MDKRQIPFPGDTRWVTISASGICSGWGATIFGMRGRYGGSMTTHRRKVLPVSAFEHAPVTCPACYSVPKQPRRRFKMVGGLLKLFAPIPVMHPQRRTAAGLPKQADSQRRSSVPQVRQQAGGMKAKKRAVNPGAGPDTAAR